ncbi:glycosyl hydrolase family 8 [Streptococcus suis]|nr:glycosyl hydrolase family 8 [Streptococcus suis]NQO90203.1 glycosyl hydrolase family 8 [Streptococcus suis]NQQ56263.1 glycosyl hydrolase family 8 [Streptococcus suis]HEM5461196.1 glycosyl hydrolase family 8 [Streptococcus suis]HEM5470988.1 glycosyl hydrolase family 8 [Streptococcus suis]
MLKRSVFPKTNKAVVIAGDYGQIRPIEAVLKSLCYNNTGLKIYLFNQDIPREWFKQHREWILRTGSQLQDVKLYDIPLNSNWTTTAHINFMTYARYFIPHYVAEDVVLYLDTDTVVTADVSELFELDLSNAYMGVVAAAFGYHEGFNAGVLLINNKRWKEENICGRLVEVTNRDHQKVPLGDQTILNRELGDQCLYIEDTYNFQIGFDLLAVREGYHEVFKIPLEPLPKILHYLTADKPWNTHSPGRLRHVWWQYHLMEWHTIIQKWVLESQVKRQEITAVVVTNTHLLEQIDYLTKSLPEVTFHIIAFTNMAPRLLKLEEKENVVLYPKAIGFVVEDILKDCDIYLDINHGSKLNDMLKVVKDQDKPVFSFEHIQASIFDDYSYHQNFAWNQSAEMVKAIREALL